MKHDIKKRVLKNPGGDRVFELTYLVQKVNKPSLYYVKALRLHYHVSNMFSSN